MLGVFLKNDLSWNTHIDLITKHENLLLLCQFKKAGMTTKDILDMYTTMVRSILENQCPVWQTSLPDYLSDQIELLQKESQEIIYHNIEHYEEALKSSNIPSLKDRIHSLCVKFFPQTNYIIYCHLQDH